jgi:hypothetical protein
VGFGEGVDPEPAVRRFPRSRDPTADHEHRGDPARSPADPGPVFGRDYGGVGGSRPQHVLVEGRQEVHRGGGPGDGELVGVLGQQVGLTALDVHPDGVVPELGEPALQIPASACPAH